MKGVKPVGVVLLIWAYQSSLLIWLPYGSALALQQVGSLEE